VAVPEAEVEPGGGGGEGGGDQPAAEEAAASKSEKPRYFGLRCIYTSNYAVRFCSPGARKRSTI